MTPATVPAAPTIGTATAGNASATVNWTAPTDTGGSPITGYKVQASSADNFTGCGGAPADATSPTVTGLTNGTGYTFTVAAINATGDRPGLGRLQQRDPGHRPGRADHRHRHRAATPRPR